ncbi:MAG TPA: NAD(P)/FAD-dependent oxidoreductase [Rhodocyclaceae bacterium]|nr:NAD(P)/FAD-dependent oxidoreductase [Rhodocyclaceae bacterium]
MLRLSQVRLPLQHPEPALKEAVLRHLGIAEKELKGFSVFKRSYDARKPKAIDFIYSIDAEVTDEAAVFKAFKAERGGPQLGQTPDMAYRYVAQAPADFPENERPIVIGMGPCGLFAALILAQMGFRPIVLERGKAVRERTQDTWGLWRKSVLNPESNVQFGEGGAGTFSDGKLYSQIKDPKFRGRKVLTEFVKAGAPAEILYVSKPHIGTFKLVGMVEEMRANINELGGEVRFQQRVEDLLVENGQVQGVVLADGQTIPSRHVVLAVGHSARDTFEMLHGRGVYIEAKPFSIGFRIEHPQSLIDKARLGPNAGNPLLGAADYKLVHHCGNGRAAYSFCMCPGGTVVAATSEPGRVVTNGMSQYSRNERNANAALVVNVSPEDFPEDVKKNPLAGITFQRHWESRAFEAGGGTYKAPAQRVEDFLAGRPSTALGSVTPSYTPGIHLTDLASCAPDYVIQALREAIPAFAKQIKGFDLPDAILTGVETRTSSPIRITRGADYQSLNTKGLFPAGEGAGYAGGILSAGVDGIEVAEAVARSIMGLPT